MKYNKQNNTITFNWLWVLYVKLFKSKVSHGKGLIDNKNG